MKPSTNAKLLSVYDPTAITTAIDALKNEGLIVFPTDTLYGLACLPDSESALRKIYAAKHRNPTKAIPILIADLHQLDSVVCDVSENAKSLMAAFWPGKLTLVLKKQAHLSPLLSASNTIAVRMPNHPFAQKLLQATGPLAVTSANLSDHENHALPDEILCELGEHIDLFLDDGKLKSTTASTIVDCSVHPPKILREGAIPSADIYKLLTQ